MIETYISLLAEWIAFAGVGVVILGVLVTIVKLLVYFVTGFNELRAAKLRHSLMIYLSLGLDFLIAKDVIITLSLEGDDVQAFIQLGAVILIRMLLSVFVHLEDKELHLVSGRSKGKKVKKPKTLWGRLIA